MGGRRQNVSTEEEKRDRNREEEDKDRELKPERKRGSEGQRLIKTEWGEREQQTQATGAKIAWIHRTSIDYLRMKSQRKSSA